METSPNASFETTTSSLISSLLSNPPELPKKSRVSQTVEKVPSSILKGYQGPGKDMDTTKTANEYSALNENTSPRKNSSGKVVSFSDLVKESNVKPLPRPQSISNASLKQDMSNSNSRMDISPVKKVFDSADKMKQSTSQLTEPPRSESASNGGLNQVLTALHQHDKTIRSLQMALADIDVVAQNNGLLSNDSLKTFATKNSTTNRSSFSDESTLKAMESLDNTFQNWRKRQQSVDSSIQLNDIIKKTIAQHLDHLSQSFFKSDYIQDLVKKQVSRQLMEKTFSFELKKRIEMEIHEYGDSFLPKWIENTSQGKFDGLAQQMESIHSKMSNRFKDQQLVLQSLQDDLNSCKQSVNKDELLSFEKHDKDIQELKESFANIQKNQKKSVSDTQLNVESVHEKINSFKTMLQEVERSVNDSKFKWETELSQFKQEVSLFRLQYPDLNLNSSPALLEKISGFERDLFDVKKACAPIDHLAQEQLNLFKQIETLKNTDSMSSSDYNERVQKNKNELQVDFDQKLQQLSQNMKSDMNQVKHHIQETNLQLVKETTKSFSEPLIDTLNTVAKLKTDVLSLKSTTEAVEYLAKQHSKLLGMVSTLQIDLEAHFVSKNVSKSDSNSKMSEELQKKLVELESKLSQFVNEKEKHNPHRIFYLLAYTSRCDS